MLSVRIHNDGQHPVFAYTMLANTQFLLPPWYCSKYSVFVRTMVANAQYLLATC